MCIWYEFCPSRCWTSCSGETEEKVRLGYVLTCPSTCSSGGVWYLGQGPEARVRLCALANDLNSFLIVSNETTVQTKLVDLQTQNIR